MPGDVPVLIAIISQVSLGYIMAKESPRCLCVSSPWPKPPNERPWHPTRLTKRTSPTAWAAMGSIT